MAIKYLSGVTVDSTVLVVDAANDRVGIGTASPSTKLEVGNFLDAVTNKITVAARYEYEPEFNFRLGQSGTNLDWIGAVISSGDDGNYNGKILFKTANAGRDTPTTKMVIKASGNVGIGTTSPGAWLQVGNSSDGRTGLIVRGGDSGAGTIIADFLNSSGNSVMEIQGNGNVGINTTAPNAKLQIVKGSSGNVASFTSDASAISNYSGITLHSATVSGDDWYGSEIRSINTAGNPNFLNPRLGFFTQDYSTYLPAGRTEKMSILGNGNVGIGTTSPSYKLDVNGATQIQNELILSTNDAAFRLYRTTGVNYFDWSSGQDLRFSTVTSIGGAGRSTAVTFLSTGNVGIGTTAPDVKFQVQGGVVKATTSNYAAPSTGGAISMFQDSNDYGTIWAVKDYNGGWANVAISPSGGNVGIGTTAPNKQLTLKAPASNYAQFALAGGDTSAFWNLYAFNDNSSFNIAYNGTTSILSVTSAGAATFSSTVTATSFIASNGGDFAWGDGSTYIDGDSSNQYIRAVVNNSERLRITSAGNVGIGTTAPIGLLHLYKAAATTRMVMDGDAGQSKIITYRTGGLQRFGLYVNNTAESGANAGSDFAVRSYNDAGTLLSTPLFIKRSTGNVGIGTTSPTYKLHVVGGAAVQDGDLRLTQGYGITWNNGDNYIKGISGYHLQFTTYDGVSAQTEVMRLTGGTAASGGARVGIGTTSPAALLEVDNQTYSATNAIANFVNGNNPVRVSYDTVVIAQTDVATLSLVETIDGTQVNEQKLTFSVGDGNAVIRSTSNVSNGIYINVAAVNSDPGYQTTSGLNAIRILNSGNSIFNYNVGIGTTSPAYRLTVNDSTTNPIAYFGLVPTNASSRNSLIILQSGTIPQSGSDTTGEVGFLFKHSYGTGGVNGTANGGYIESIRESVFGITSQVNTALVFGTSAANTDGERMRITSAGNVGIGTTAPSSLLSLSKTGLVDFQLNASDQATDEKTWVWQAGAPVGVGVYRLRAVNDAYTNGVNAVTFTRSGISSVTATFSSSVEATSFIKTSGTAAQFLKADGTVDSSTYLTANQTITLSGVVTGSGTTAITTAIANGAITNAMLANSSFFVGTTSIDLGRASAAQTLTGVSIDGNAATATEVYRTVTAGTEANLVSATIGDNDFFRIRTGGASNAGFVEIATADDGTEPIYVRQYTGVFATLTRTATLLDGSGNTSFPGSVTASSLIKSGGTASQYLMADGSVSTLTNPVTGTGTTNYVPKFTSASAIGNSAIYDNAGNIGIGVTNADYPLTVGSINVGAVGAQLGLILNSVINTAIPSSSVKAIIGVTNSGFGYAAGSLLIQPRTGVSAVTVFSTEGTEKMRITEAGNVGIGTTNPGGKLDVTNSTVAVDRAINIAVSGARTATTYGQVLSNSATNATTDGINKIGLYIDSTGTFTGGAGAATNNYGLYIDTISGADNNYGAYISGNVGIGTTAPVSALSVVGKTNLGNQASGFYVTPSTLHIASSTVSQISFEDYVVTAAIAIANNTFAFGHQNASPSYEFKHSNTYNGNYATTGTTFARFNPTTSYISAGNVGIGTTSPARLLTVYTGDPNSSTTPATNTAILIDSAANQYLEFRTASASSGYMQGLLFTDNGRNAFIGFKEYTGAAAGTYGESVHFSISDFSGSDAGSGFYFGTSSNNENGVTSPLVFLRSNGNMMIGTTTDSGYKLRVNGTSYFDGLAHFGQTATSGSAFRWGAYGTAVSSDTMLAHNQLWNGSGWTILSSAVGTSFLNLGGQVASPNIEFGTGGANTAATTKMIILNSGNVGIGTTAPAAKLDVIGVVRGVMPSDPTTGAVVAKFLSYSPSPFGLVFRGYGTGAHSIQVQRESNDAELFALSLQPLGGNVGIGTTSPNSQLSLYATTTAYMNFRNATNISSTYGLVIEATNNESEIWNYANGYMRFGTNNSERLRITSTGNVGIGTTSPAARLQVAGSAAVNTREVIADFRNSSDSQRIDIRDENAATTQPPGLYSATAGYGLGLYAGGASAPIILYAGGITNSEERMRILGTNGNVGIGTTAPSEKLHVDGSSLITYNNSFQSTNSVGNKAILARVSPTSGIINYAEYATATNLNGFVIGSDDARVKGNITGDSLEFITNTSTRMTVLSSGNVGINTTTPGSTLHVVGDVLIQTGALGVGVNPSATDGRIDAGNDIVAFSTSDKRLKENITPIANALEKVRSLTGVEFDWKEETKSVHGYEGHDVGVIAQDVQAVLPEAVRTNDSGYLSVRYEKMIALLIEGMKEQQAQIDELKAQINDSSR